LNSVCLLLFDKPEVGTGDIFLFYVTKSKAFFNASDYIAAA